MPPILQKSIKVAVIGKGAREHALAWKIAESPFCSGVIVIPGNPGMHWAGIECVATDSMKSTDIVAALKENKVQFVVIGPDDLLAAGLADDLMKAGFDVFGPTQKAAKLEWSKNFAKEMMNASGVPTAQFTSWTSFEEATSGLSQTVKEMGGFPIVLKYDGLALGKGVKISYDETEATEFLEEVFNNKKFSKSSSDTVVICEEFITGHEVSVFALCDGEKCVLLEPACDHKRLLDGNRGPNTGGMGAYSPVPWISKEALSQIKEKVFDPILKTMKDRKTPFSGLLYAGMMMSGDKPYVLEFNARFGDPETQCILPRMDSDFLVLIYSCAKGDLESGLDQAALRWKKDACVNVVVASQGYPEKPVIGKSISGLEEKSWNEYAEQKAFVFFAGTEKSEKEFVTSGGRVLGVSQVAPSLELARAEAYSLLGQRFDFEGRVMRSDVGSFYGS